MVEPPAERARRNHVRTRWLSSAEGAYRNHPHDRDLTQYPHAFATEGGFALFWETRVDIGLAPSPPRWPGAARPPQMVELARRAESKPSPAGITDRAQERCLQTDKSVGIPGDEQHAFGRRDGCDQQIGQPSTRVTTPRASSGIHVTVGASRGNPERDWFKGRFDALKPVLSTCPLERIGGSCRPGRQFSQGDRADSELSRKLPWLSSIERSMTAEVSSNAVGCSASRPRLSILNHGAIDVLHERIAVDTGGPCKVSLYDAEIHNPRTVQRNDLGHRAFVTSNHE